MTPVKNFFVNKYNVFVYVALGVRHDWTRTVATFDNSKKFTAQEETDCALLYCAKISVPPVFRHRLLQQHFHTIMCMGACMK